MRKQVRIYRKQMWVITNTVKLTDGQNEEQLAQECGGEEMKMAKEDAGLDLKRQKQCSLVIIIAVKLAGDQQHEEKYDDSDEEDKEDESDDEDSRSILYNNFHKRAIIG